MKNIKRSQIPKIIHQVWEGRNGDVPADLLLRMAATWKEENPSWEYRFWNYQKIDRFLLDYFPRFISKYFSFRYDIQRWDAIRYLILFKFGGIYADLDTECLESLDWLQKFNDCCMGMEPPEHSGSFKKPFIIGNAFMATRPVHPFFTAIIKEISGNNSRAADKFNYVLETTGPKMISNLYESYPGKKQICLIPYELVSPLSKTEVKIVINGKATDIIAEKIEKAYVVHYYFGSWCDDVIFTA